MSRMSILLGVLGALILAGGAFALVTFSRSGAVGANNASGDYVTLNASLDEFINDFNEETGKTRLVFVVGPSCGPCLRGLDDMNRVVGDMTRNNPDLVAFVLFVPTLGAQESNAARAVRLMQGPDIRHYWDPEGQSGVVLQKALGISAYAWDVWLVYDGEAEWAESAPSPVYWEHQLGGLSRDKRLDPNRFAQKVKSVLQAQKGR